MHAPIWLVAAGLLSVIAATLFVSARLVSAPLAWTALGVTVGLFGAMLIVARAMPVGFRRATVFAWLLVTLTIVAVAAALVLAVIDSSP